MPSLSPFEWLLVILAGMGIGLSKSGFSGVSLFHVLVFAFLFGAKASTGIVLPMLFMGDTCAVLLFKQHARWDYVRRLLWPTTLGVVIGWLVMLRLDETAYKPLIGVIIVGLTALQLGRMWKPDWFARMPHSLWFAWTVGLLAGFSTMIANAAGPIVSLYLLTVALPKHELVGTHAWLFLILNFVKLPFSYHLQLIAPATLSLNVLLFPAILAGLFGGRWLINRIPQRLFDSLILIFSAVAAIRLIVW